MWCPEGSDFGRSIAHSITRTVGLRTTRVYGLQRCNPIKDRKIPELMALAIYVIVTALLLSRYACLANEVSTVAYFLNTTPSRQPFQCVQKVS